MLFSNDDLDGIASGRITLAFRRWKAARVRPGTRLRTRIGLVEVLDVREVDGEAIRSEDIAAAGFADRQALDRWVDGRGGRLFRVAVRPAGPDPRVALRNESVLDQETVADIANRLERLDRAAPRPWAWQTLRLISASPGTVSTELAAQIGEERFAFKRRVRRLKELGLTESLQTGYRVSPRGEALLRSRRGNAD